MKKIFFMIFTMLVFLNFTAVGYCDSPADKLTRGICNVLTFPLEVPNRVMQTNKRAGPTEAITYGLFEGIAMTCFRGAIGMYEVVTFFIPLPEGYKPIIDDPEYLLNLHKK